MEHEKICNRQDGSRVKIWVRIVIHSFSKKIMWSYVCSKCAKGRRKFVEPPDTERSLVSAAQYRKNRYLTIASADEVLETMRELIAKIEPSLD